METNHTAVSTVDEYIQAQSGRARELLVEMRETIKRAAPDATEKMSYGIPTFFFHGNLVHYAAFKNHIGFYPAPRGIEAFEAELQAYKGGKGTVKFPLDQPLPLDLITRIVKFRIQDNLDSRDSS